MRRLAWRNLGAIVRWTGMLELEPGPLAMIISTVGREAAPSGWDQRP